ncbi:hypothetical protein B0J12DRAFT_251059 [Macrophomina phaseolina]|uniref:Secreted protein n=1 Tax=Macrophomina phaseolina TaxID=35725 RepID=A0ABQ8FZN1_9PEZI|nr:hypothetical protein B0J12DRAFT_251059 [Macrophomina phaseolina]
MHVYIILFAPIFYPSISTADERMFLLWVYTGQHARSTRAIFLCHEHTNRPTVRGWCVGLIRWSGRKGGVSPDQCTAGKGCADFFFFLLGPPDQWPSLGEQVTLVKHPALWQALPMPCRRPCKKGRRIQFNLKRNSDSKDGFNCCR